MAETLFARLKTAMQARDEALSAYRQHKMAGPFVSADDEMNRLAGDALPHLLAVVEAAQELLVHPVGSDEWVRAEARLATALAPLFEESEQ